MLFSVDAAERGNAAMPQSRIQIHNITWNFREGRRTLNFEWKEAGGEEVLVKPWSPRMCGGRYRCKANRWSRRRSSVSSMKHIK